MSEEKSEKSAYKIDSLLLGQLLKDIEESGKTRDEVNLLAVCNRKEVFYGKPGSTKRRALQRKFDDLKRRSARSYKNYIVEEYNVTPGAGLLKECQEEEARRVIRRTRGKRHDRVLCGNSSSLTSPVVSPTTSAKQGKRSR